MFSVPNRYESYFRLAITAPAGSGKTNSSLRIANGLTNGEGIFLIDTEHGSGRLEIGKPDIPVYLHDNLIPPYTPERYIEKCNEAVKAGAKVIIIDSLSSSWSGEGGLLEQKDAIADKSRDAWGAWRKITPKHDKFMNSLLALPCHLICTMRTKTAWDISTDDNGKKKIVKFGLKPDLREDVDYYFTTVFSLHVETHTAECMKDRTDLFDGKEFVPTLEHGQQIKAWIDFNMADFLKKSAENLESFKAEIDLMTSEESIVNWYKTNLGKFKSSLADKDFHILIQACGLKKNSFVQLAKAA